MGRWYKPQEFFKRFTHKKELRELCREKYGDDFVKMYDMVNKGIPKGIIFRGNRCRYPKDGET